jgi:hypothetical protein
MAGETAAMTAVTTTNIARKDVFLFTVFLLSGFSSCHPKH